MKTQFPLCSKLQTPRSRRCQRALARTVIPAGVALLALASVAPAFGSAQTNVVSESRYLLIFDSSAAMKRRWENVQRVAGDLIYTGMNGQMRSGDTIGVWTFNESLYAGNLPLLRWAPERRRAVAGRVTDFLRAQKLEKAGSFDTVVPSLQRVISNSVKLTVLIFSDGVSPISGTPYDAEVNAAYQPFRDTQKQERMPFVTVLRAKDRVFLGYAVTPSPWAVEFPKFPPDPVVPKVVPKPEPPRPAVPPLIVIGKKDTNAPIAVELPQPGTEPKPEPKPSLTEAEKLFIKLAAEQGVELPANLASNAAAATATTAPPQPATAPPEPTKPPVATESPPKPASPPAETKVQVQTAPAPATTVAVTNAPATEQQPAPEVQAVVVPTDKQQSTRLLLLAGGASVLVVSLGVIYALLRRRHRPHVSLITSSMDRRQK